MLFLCVLRVLCGESVFFRAENKFTLAEHVALLASASI